MNAGTVQNISEIGGRPTPPMFSRHPEVFLIRTLSANLVSNSSIGLYRGKARMLSATTRLTANNCSTRRRRPERVS
jgi:hypothetical protein